MLLDELKKEINKKPPTLISGDKSATVALLLRRSTKNKENGSLDIFFIVRALNPKDRWSGQIAFPGGRGSSGETEIETATRECFEELGISLENYFDYCGRLSDRRVYEVNKILVVSCLVFLLKDSQQQQPLPFNLDPKEVFSCGWVPLNEINENEVTAIIFKPYEYPGNNKLFIGNFASLIGIDKLCFPKIEINLIDKCYPNKKENNINFQDLFPPLWGLTLSMTSEILVKLGMVKHEIKLGQKIGFAHHLFEKKIFWTNIAFENQLHTLFLSMLTYSGLKIGLPLTPYEYCNLYTKFLLSLTILGTGTGTFVLASKLKSCL